MTETNELSEQDKKDLKAMGIDPDQTTERSLLEVWGHVLANVEPISQRPITIHEASRVIASWPQLSYQDTPVYHNCYHSILASMREHLNQLVAKHPDALGWTGDDDGQRNHALYLELLVTWHCELEDLETEWRAEDEHSHVWAAAIADARAFVFAQVGLAGHLDAINFSLADDEFLAAVRAYREEQGE